MGFSGPEAQEGVAALKRGASRSSIRRTRFDVIRGLSRDPESRAVCPELSGGTWPRRACGSLDPGHKARDDTLVEIAMTKLQTRACITSRSSAPTGRRRSTSGRACSACRWCSSSQPRRSETNHLYFDPGDGR
jgi:hypothetical protein